MKTFPNNHCVLSLAALTLLGASPLLPGQDIPSSITLAPIPQMTMVEVRYSTPKSGAPEADQTSQPPPNAVIAKGRSSSIKSQTWPDQSTSCDVRINGWRFFNDVTARAKYRDYVQVIELGPNESGPQDFPELSFAGSQAKLTESNYKGKMVWLLTAAPSAPKYTDSSISTLLERIGQGPDRQEIETNLREAQRLEAKRASEPPNQVWVDPLTRLPIAAKIDGQLVTYTYKRLSELPQLPKPFQEAILAKFGKLPEF